MKRQRRSAFRTLRSIQEMLATSSPVLPKQKYSAQDETEKGRNLAPVLRQRPPGLCGVIRCTERPQARPAQQWESTDSQFGATPPPKGWASPCCSSLLLRSSWPALVLLGPVDILDVLALVPFGRKRLATVLAREPPVRPVLVVLVLAPRAHVLEELGTRVAAVVALRTPAEVVVQPNRREVPAAQTSAVPSMGATACTSSTSTAPGGERGRGEKNLKSGAGQGAV